MSVAPDFEHYTISELEDALVHVDRVAFPDRVEEIEKFLGVRERDGDVESLLVRQAKESKRSFSFKKIFSFRQNNRI